MNWKVRLTSLGLLTLSALAFGQQCANICLEGLKTAAYNEISIRKETHSVEEIKVAACEAVKQLKSGNRSTSGDALTNSFIARFRDQSQYWDEYERLYCSASSNFSKFDDQFSFWSKLVEPRALDTFLGCVKACNPTQGLLYDSSIVDACTTGIKVVYRPPAGTSGKVNLHSKPTLTNASCTGLPSVNQQFDEHGFSCRLNNRKPGLVTLNTNRGSLLIPLPGVPEPQRPDPPVYTQVYSDKDDKGTPYVAKFQVDTDVWAAAHRCRLCSGTFDLPQGARIPTEDYVSYECLVGACGWSYNTHLQHPREYEKDITITGSQVIWRRHWQGDRVIELYTIRYQMPHNECISGCDYEQKLAEYERMIKTDPCASAQESTAALN